MNIKAASIFLTLAFLCTKVKSADIEVHYLTSPRFTHPKIVWEQFLNEDGKSFTDGFIEIPHIDHWFKITVSSENNNYLIIDNPHIDSLIIYEIPDFSNPKYVAGELVPYNKTRIDHRYFGFPLSNKKVLLCKVVKRSTKSFLSFQTILADKLFSKVNKENLTFGILLGTILICSLGGLVLFVLLKERLYLLYFLASISILFYNLIDLGYAFQYAYPNYPSINVRLNFFFSFLIAPLWFYLYSQFINLHKSSIKIINLVMLLILISICLGSIFRDFLIAFSSYAIIALLILICSFLAFISYKVVVNLTSKRENSLILLAILIMALAGVFNSMKFFGAKWSVFIKNPLLYASAIESILLLIAITLKVRSMVKERDEIAGKQQKELLLAFAEGTDKERSRISVELHDNFGSRLTTIKRFLSVENSRLLPHVDALLHDIRALSHQLSPHLIKFEGIEHAINRLLLDFADISSIKFNLQVSLENLSINEELSFHLFRISQELIQNVLKHSRATNCNIQLFTLDHNLILLIEDDGIGFNYDLSSNAGIGFKNISARIHGLGGKINIDTRLNQGTTIIVTIPLH